MAARAIWKGILNVGTAKIPVKLYSALEDQNIHFNILDSEGKLPIKQRMVDPETEKEIPAEEIQRGVEVEPGTFIVLKENELAKFQPKSSREIEFLRFVPHEKITHQWYDRPYYLGPDGDDSAYFSLVAALDKSKREGVARWVMRDKQHIGALGVKEGYLVLVTLRKADEVISAKQLPRPIKVALNDREVRLAEQLVIALQDEFRPEDYRDNYRECVMEFIQAKAKGRKPKLQIIRTRKPPASLVSALEKSLKRVKQAGGKAVA